MEKDANFILQSRKKQVNSIFKQLIMKNIWLIDDDQASHVYHKVMIEDAGLDVTKVTSLYSVDDAIQMLISLNEKVDPDQWPDYIFLDLNMPVKSGYTFIDEFQTIDLNHKLPDIYFVSSTKNPIDIEKVEKLEQVKGFETKFLEKEFFERLI